MPSKPVYTEIEGQRLKITNLQKVLYPSKGYTKAEIISYAIAVAPFMLPFVKGRPLTLIRYPDGIGQKTFYTKNKPSWTPDWIPTTYLPWDEDNEYLLANAAPHLVWLANLAALEVHTMNSTIAQINHPDQFVVDLDPPEDQDFEVVRDIALKLKSFLESYGYHPFAKLSGGKGIHVVVPILPKWEYEIMTDTVKELMKEFITSNPTTTLSISKTRRTDKTLLDIYRNHPGNTIIAPYSLRGKEGGPISMPLTWEEIANCNNAQAYDINEALAYVKEKGNPWKGFYDKAVKLHNQSIPTPVIPLKDYEDKRDFSKTAEPDSTETIAFDPSEVNNKYVIHLHHATRLHYDLRLGVDSVLKSWAIPKGLPIEKGVKRLAIQTEDHPAKYIDFEGVIPKEEYGGGQMWVFETGKIEWLQKGKTKYKFKLLNKQTEATFSLYRIKGNEWIIQRAESVNLDIFKHPMKPMLCGAISKLPPKKEAYEYEIKWDGIRVIYYKNKEDIKLMSRSGRNIIDQFPEFKEGAFIRVQHAIIDCEIVCLDEAGRPIFADVISRMHRIGERNIAAASKTKPAYMYAFDCLYLDGKRLTSYPLSRRKEWLRAIFKTGDKPRLSTTFHDGAEIYNAAKQMGLEGIMAKHKDGKYSPGARSDTWKKLKFTETFECHIIGYTKGKGDRIDIFGALHLANPNGDTWTYHGKVGTGFDQKKMKDILKQLQQLETISKPIKESVDEEKDTVWILPQYLCEVTYASFSPNETLREPVFLKMWAKD